MWAELKSLRSVDIGGTLGDVDSHLKAGHPYKDSDKVTWTHEATHGVNSRIRNEHKVRNGYYCLEDRAFLIPTNPSFTLKELAQAIPKEDRGRSYQLYLVNQQRYWNNDPLYVLDELTAYTLGAKAGYELESIDRANYSRENAMEFFRYGQVAQEMARERGFAEQESLDEFLAWFGREMMPLCA